MHGTHMRYLLVAGGGLAVGLLAAGTSLRSLLPFALILVCPLMMVFMMRGMHGGSGHEGHSDGDQHDTLTKHPDITIGPTAR